MGKTKIKDTKKKDKNPVVVLPSQAAVPPSFEGKIEKDSAKKDYEKEMKRLQVELVKLQEWVRSQKLRVVVIFEGRDAAGKGGVIKTISGALNPRICKIVALDKPTEKEKTQWYFQRYIAHLPSAGEIILFDRSWYNRAGVEKVMGFCTDEEYQEFMRACPQFETMLTQSGIILVKYWFSVSPDVQKERFEDRSKTPEKRWKLSDMDIKGREKWTEFSKAKDVMFAYTDTESSPWHVVNGDHKKRARLNCITHLLNLIHYEDIIPEPVKLPDVLEDEHYTRTPIGKQHFVPEIF
ncbi:MAG: polyphosphate kinase 2 [Bacteroidetes bacterium]|nr:MAG: polyphosphate kinase 2 [Bacteroidota bacterium]